MSSVRPKRVKAIRGRVIQDIYGKGSKSERETIFIETPDGRYIIRRKKGPVFDDIELKQYIGHEVECDGFIIDNTILLESIRVLS